MANIYEDDFQVLQVLWYAYASDKPNRTRTPQAIADEFGGPVELVEAAIRRLSVLDQPFVRESAAAPGRWLLNIEWVRNLPLPADAE
jgi:hypothetical protein